MTTNFYVYEHWRLDRDECFYVGKGKGKRAYRTDRNTHWKNIVDKLERIGSAWEVRIVESGLTERQAFDLEIERIAFWCDIVDLTNMTDGGEGCSGYKHSEEACSKISVLNIGKRLSKETREKLSVIAKNMPVEQRAKLSRKLMGNKNGLGKHHSAETRAKLSAASKGNKCRLGHKHSEETRTKISAAVKQAFNVGGVVLTQVKRTRS